ncbi:uncharacterized protein LOC110186549 [Drosophila serrata]|uniref:uncharacterized protein LOC110186549 n=1 Tax=Drosophila serrata TaxID=7274 RepID=UPI000A1D3187|nr:uncharacterized protein LOC110186549 [Drosophila serrata]
MQPKRAKRAGLTKEATWKRLGFLSADKEGKDGDPKKYRAICIHCQKYQSNTSIERLIIHRKSCATFREDLTKELGVESGKAASLRKSTAHRSINSEPSATADVDPDAPANTEFNSTASLMEKLLDEDDELVRIDLDQLVAPLPSDSNRLQKDLIKAETEYLETKSIYFNKMNEIAELRRTVTMLEAKKTQLEIIKLRAECE